MLSGITVLVIDHSSGLNSRSVGTLHLLGTVTAVSVPDHADAGRILEKQTPEFILVEHRDGSTSPLEWLTQVRSHSPRVPVALLAGPDGEKLLVEALREGADCWGSTEDFEQFSKRILDRFLQLGRKDSQDHGLADYMTGQETRLELGNDYKLLSVILGYLQEELVRCNICDELECLQAGIALSEALTNALYHGNLDVSSSLRNSDERAYFNLAESRRTQMPYKDRRIHVNVRINDEQATFVVQDEGAGFDITSLPDPTDPANLEKGSGRGVLLMRSFMDEVSYNSAGNQVVMIKRARVPFEEAP